ncbi:hypothetical protein ACIQNU_43675 [Streptomyces sp. NPDC091292]|uniref:hypothetical protein n=1 Tax=Streptomyces sp. NPDC091292 TaxID=3365991 RepID=UPI0038222F11
MRTTDRSSCCSPIPPARSPTMSSHSRADLHEDDVRRLFTEFVAGQADGGLAWLSRNLLRVRDRARTPRALLERLQDAAPATEATTTASP